MSDASGRRCSIRDQAAAGFDAGLRRTDAGRASDETDFVHSRLRDPEHAAVPVPPRNQPSGGVFSLLIRTTEGDTEVADEVFFSRRVR